MLFGPGALQESHRRWFENHLPKDYVQYKNCSDEWHGMAISGPKSRELLSRICRDDVSAESLKFRDIRETFVAGVPCILNRLSFTGELGFEIYTAPHFQLKLFEEMENKGKDLGLKLYGARALMSMRLEKNWGAWGLDYRPDFTALESGLDQFINWQEDFIGKQAALKEKEEGLLKKFSAMVVNTSDIDVINDEAIMKESKCVGYVTSGGYAHHVQKSIAFGYLPTALIKNDIKLEIEINGKFFSANIIHEPLYDPKGLKMRS
jgi:dimethylglycine dehydrogenase